ncbi:hypothetical protein [Cytobacillus gottheilii]|uniref:Uncharacterized protein n=1 Tax=Cytobacillus gottheilii TaxID=859144 RepID=A0ABX8FDM0_9BACI|nr:hypothetical protein [Cytobacillus gottheilii]QVY61347.1 hypothetical protein J1899_20785 [Cytobacillus gottheilii]
MYDRAASDNTVECMLESLIRMQGKSNQRVEELSKRVGQLELIILSQSKNEHARQLVDLEEERRVLTHQGAQSQQAQ